MRLAAPKQPLDDSWKQLPVQRRGTCRLGISFRPRQVEAFGLDGPATLARLLSFPFELIRLAAYWNRIEPREGVFDTSELDWQLEAAESSGKQVILSVGAVKNFGYPEFFVPPHQLGRPLTEGELVRPATHERLLAAARRFISRMVTRYRHRSSIVAWQLEHEAVDPLGVEHSWRLSEDFVKSELGALKEADPDRPVMMNGFLPMAAVVRLNQWWRTRDQGDSLAVASRLADIVGIDYYPRHALLSVGPRTLYVDGGHKRVRVPGPGKRLMISEGGAARAVRRPELHAGLRAHAGGIVTALKRPTALVPLAMSLAALGVVLIHIAIAGSAREPDEGTAAHLWQLLMAGQIPIIAIFAISWLPRAPRQAMLVLTLQLAAGLAAAAPVFLLGL